MKAESLGKKYLVSSVLTSDQVQPKMTRLRVGRYESCNFQVSCKYIIVAVPYSVSAFYVGLIVG